MRTRFFATSQDMRQPLAYLSLRRSFVMRLTRTSETPTLMPTTLFGKMVFGSGSETEALRERCRGLSFWPASTAQSTYFICSET